MIYSVSPRSVCRPRVVGRHTSMAGAIALWLLFCLSKTTHAQNAPRGLDFSGSVTPLTGDMAGQQLYHGSHVLIVGISKYQHLSRPHWLQFADKDARDLRDLLIRSYGFPPSSITMLLDEKATLANIEAALNSFADEGVTADDRVLIYFSGHGQTVPTGAGGELGFLIPYDAQIDLNNTRNKSGYFSSCIPMDSIWRLLSACAARHALIIVDACYGGLLVHPKSLGDERPNTRVIASLLTRDARQVLTAGGAGETAIENPTLGHGAFTYKLLEELRAQAATPDTVFTASELASAVRTSVANLTNAHQTPVFGNYEATEGDFVFLTTKPKRVPPFNSDRVGSTSAVNGDGGASHVDSDAAPERPSQTLPPVSLDLHEAPVQRALEQLFRSAGVQFRIDGDVSGFVTLKVVDLPFDQALVALLHSATTPLTFSIIAGVYIVKLRDQP